jgi:ABC-type uncharacterized transport system fused permease/ATPase subunit
MFFSCAAYLKRLSDWKRHASAMRKKMEEDEDDDSDKIRITDDDIKLDDLGIFDFDNTGSDNKSPVVQDINFQLDIDELPA